MKFKNIALRTICWGITALWVAIIFGFSSQSGQVSLDTSNSLLENILRVFISDYDSLSPSEVNNLIETFQTVIRKIAHLCEYAVLGVLLSVSLKVSGLRLRLIPLVAAMSGLLVAVTDEVYQFFVPDRGPGAIDVIIDFAGVLLGIIFTQMIIYIIKKALKKSV